jgi:hypothetical protein
VVRREEGRQRAIGAGAVLEERGSRTRRRAAHALAIGVPLACVLFSALTRSRAFSVIGSAGILIGTALSKYSDIADGNRSTQRPDIYLRFTQPRTERHE